MADRVVLTSSVQTKAGHEQLTTMIPWMQSTSILIMPLTEYPFDGIYLS